MNAENWQPPYVVSTPVSAQNAELLEMVRLYSSLLTTAPLRARMLEMLRTKQPDGAAALLYFLEFPKLVYTARNTHCEDPSSGTKRHGHAPGTAEKFPLRNVLKQIQKDKEILCWCRETLDNASAHDVVVASSISLLYGASAIGLATPQKMGPVILGGQALSRERAVGNFFDILARNVTRPGLPLGSVMDGLQLAVSIHATYNHQPPLCNLPSAPQFLRAIDRLGSDLTESDARKIRIMFTKQTTISFMDDMLHELRHLNGDQPLDTNYSGQDIVRDGRESLRAAREVLLFVLRAAASQATRSVSGVNCLATARAPVKRLIGKRTKRSANSRRSRRLAQMLLAMMLPLMRVAPTGAQGRPPRWPKTTRHL